MIQIAKHSVAWVVLAAAAAAANAQQASGPVVKMTAVNQAAISQPQFTEVDVPLIRQGLPQRSNGRSG